MDKKTTNFIDNLRTELKRNIFFGRWRSSEVFDNFGNELINLLIKYVIEQLKWLYLIY